MAIKLRIEGCVGRHRWRGEGRKFYGGTSVCKALCIAKVAMLMIALKTCGQPVVETSDKSRDRLTLTLCT